MPILDCWEELNASQLREKHNIEITLANSKGQTELRHMQLSAKCLKWRTVITTASGCNTESDWKFHAFIPKRS
ncbi:hypothetical protein [Flavobacterium selenitireducens]|uniref:hypothetical protein n=1 Tax=Flavobacterium selenitireducens TaxID=2722704 RepID=UPI00168A42CA|nr:hypothetical protein [Flavobacterium selenitireducens]MBD3582695.1 hypothetical protein [Flavobacterium selenitireducens]